MRSNESSTRLGQFLEGHPDVEVAELQSVMDRIQSAIRYVVPRSHQPYVGNALLNLAVSRMVSETGAQATATMLIRLVDSVVEHGEPPPAEAAIDLTAKHS